MSANRVLCVVLASAWTVACGGGLPSVPAVPAIPTAPTLSAPTAAPAPAAPPPSAEASAPPAAKEAPAPTAASEDADAANERERAKATPPPPAEPVEAKGKLLTKPAKGTFQIEVTSNAPAVGDEAELSRIIDKSVPLFGGGWIVIAKTEVVKVDGKKVTLKILEERAQMKVNGKKLDHFTPGVAVRMKVAKKA